MTLHEACANPSCAICRNHFPFVLPDELILAAQKGKLVIFAGAGISTEGRQVFPYTFFEEICLSLGIDGMSMGFPEVMTLFCKRPNGRRQLLQRIRSRLDNVLAFPQLYRRATNFHREISTIPHIHTIITTNWDDFFERECGATPIVTVDDYAFWDQANRRVIKLHGSINNLGSIVATVEDYERCYQGRLSGLIGSTLKHLLATSTLVFIGYSFRDTDFLQLYTLLIREMGQMLPHCYVVSLDTEVPNRVGHDQVTLIRTDGTYFVSQLKRELIDRGCMLSDSNWRKVEELRTQLEREHIDFVNSINPKKHPESIFATAYQDGLIDSLDRINARYNSGEYSDPSIIKSTIAAYLRLQKDKRRLRRYDDVAYIEGYVNGLQWLLADDTEREQLPRYYLPKYGGILDVSEYQKRARKARSKHRRAYSLARKIADKLSDGSVYHHPPWLS